MTFTWPLALLSLLLIPILLGIYVWQLRKKRRSAVRFSSIDLIRASIPNRSKWRRHIPAALFLLGLSGVGVATARPQAKALVPTTRTSIILTLDVSRSMCADDVDPNRITVAQEAARVFIRDQPGGTRIGLVAFSGFAEVIVAPTTDKQALLKAVDALTTSRGTVIGAAILKSLNAVSSVNPEVPPVEDDTTPAEGIDNFGGPAIDPITGLPVDPAKPATTIPERPTPPGGYIPDIVVLLTDGANTRGVDPVTAAKQAATRRVRVYTIGFGTENPSGSMSCTVDQLGGDISLGGGFGGGGAIGGGGFGGGRQRGGGGFGGGGRRRFLVTDEPTLKAVAAMTGGKFYKAQDAKQLKGVFANLPRDVQLQKRRIELSAGFAALGALLTALAVFLSLLWNRST
jgi:Ca-activated chloride channel homolog